MFYAIYVWKTLTLGDIKCAKDFLTKEEADKWLDEHPDLIPIAIAESIK